MATPHVAGLAGLLESYYINFTPAQIRATILRYVDILPTLQGWIQTGGRINAYKAVTSLLPPTGLSATGQSPSQITLSWTDHATGEDGYRIERRSADGNFIEKIVEVAPNTSSYTDGGLSPSTAYNYRVRAFNTIPAESLDSNAATASTFAADTQTTTTSTGGGGGCSIGRKHNGPTQVVDALVMLAPLFAIIALRNLRRKKK